MPRRSRQVQGPLRFRDLPPELRNRVYGFYLTQTDDEAARTPSTHKFGYSVDTFTDPETEVAVAYYHGKSQVAARKNAMSRKKAMASLGTAIFLVCKQMYQEAASLVYSIRSFDLDIIITFALNMGRITLEPHPAFKNIQTLHVYLSAPYGFIEGRHIDVNALRANFRPLKEMVQLKMLKLSPYRIDQHTLEDGGLNLLRYMLKGIVRDVPQSTKTFWYTRYSDSGFKIGNMAGKVISQHFDIFQSFGTLETRSSKEILLWILKRKVSATEAPNTVEA